MLTAQRRAGGKLKVNVTNDDVPMKSKALNKQKKRQKVSVVDEDEDDDNTIMMFELVMMSMQTTLLDY